MRKLFFIICMMSVLLNILAADHQPPGDYLPLDYVAPVINPSNGHGRGPIYIPHVCIDDHNLYFMDSDEFFTSIIAKDDDASEHIVFSACIPASQTLIELPSYLSGSFTIKVVRNEQTFVGSIILQ